jgi:rhodanese-related sulfurtransferase
MSLFDRMFGAHPAAAPGEARRLVAEGALLLDVRTPAEFAAGHLPGATNLPVQELAFRIGEVPAGCKVVVYCRSGARSAVAAKILKGEGHEVLDIGTMQAF